MNPQNPNDAPVLHIEHLSKSFGDLSVLKDISMDVHRGEIVSIIGPSGSGKSTLLRCCTLLEAMTSGMLAYGDTIVCQSAARDTKQYASPETLRQVRRKFGLVFQNFNLFPHCSVMKNIIDAPICVQKRDKNEVIRDAELLLQKMGLAERGDYYPFQLSGGQQQRVSIARALINKPEIIFFDEPTSALDPELTGEILKVIRDLAAMHMTMVIVTHEIEFARNVSDRIIFMADGVIVEQGPANDVILHPTQERTRAFLANMQNK